MTKRKRPKGQGTKDRYPCCPWAPPATRERLLVDPGVRKVYARWVKTFEQETEALKRRRRDRQRPDLRNHSPTVYLCVMALPSKGKPTTFVDDPKRSHKKKPA